MNLKMLIGENLNWVVNVTIRKYRKLLAKEEHYVTNMNCDAVL